jgi:glutamyl-tRNA synthetase
VIRRADELFAYQLAVVVDDILMGITDVVRGADLLDSTPRQIALWEAFGFAPPKFWHVPMMHDDEGKRMSKRDGSQSLLELREMGWTADRAVGHLAASLGWVDPGTHLSTGELLDTLDLDSFREALSG